MKKLSLSFKIYFILSILVVGCIIVSALGLSKMSDIRDGLNRIVSGSVQRVGLANTAKSIFLDQVVNEKNIILELKTEDIKRHSARLEDNHTKLIKTLDDLYQLIFAEAGKKDLLAAKANVEEWWRNNQKIRENILSGAKSEAFDLSMNVGRIQRFKVEESIDGILQRNVGFMNEEVKLAESEYNKARNLVILTSFIAILSGMVLAALILRAVNRSIDQVIASLTDNSSQVTAAAHQIASSSEELSQAATEQASSLEETAASIEEMNSMIQKNAESARRTAELSNNSNEKAEKGKVVVLDMIKAIEDISTSNTNIMNQVEESNKKISEIVKVISEIGEKTKVINEIVFQTKLLSFNASVEAARAGEQGKGFAVVAEEVGNLAQMSGNAAEEITSMLEGSIVRVKDIVDETRANVDGLIQDGRLKVQTGSQVARECGEVLNEIVVNVSQVTRMANEIATACHEQALGVQEITKAMNQLDQVTQTNAATSEEAASATKELSSQAESLRQTVAILVQEIKGQQEMVAAAKAATAPAAKATPVVRKPIENKVLPMKTAAKEMVKSSAKKKVVGIQDLVPSENDPRFEEV